MVILLFGGERMDKNDAQFVNQNYLNLETFRRNNEPVKTPVWFVYDSQPSKYYVRTGQGSGKVKRVNNNSKVNIMPCGQSGEPLGSWVPAQARIVSDEATFALVRSLLVEKYGDMVATFEARALAAGQIYTVIMIELGA
jgi:PPOX class probable F420-dependent enzyme